MLITKLATRISYSHADLAQKALQQELPASLGAMPVMKRPASKTAEESEPGTFKRPASKPSKPANLCEKVKALKANALQSQEEEDDSEHRDKGKAAKFKQMRASLPPHILNLYDAEAKKKSSPRAFRTQAGQLVKEGGVCLWTAGL